MNLLIDILWYITGNAAPTHALAVVPSGPQERKRKRKDARNIKLFELKTKMNGVEIQSFSGASFPLWRFFSPRLVDLAYAALKHSQHTPSSRSTPERS